MNNVMWDHPATRRNLRKLEDDGCIILGPDNGPQACGETGPGRMLEPEALFAAVGDYCLSTAKRNNLAAHGRSSPRLGRLQGKRVLITAGPTREAIDPVRYISNESSGKQGYALATAAMQAGGEVTLISGPVSLEPPAGVKTISVINARQMHDAVQAQLPEADIFIGVAAVADYRPAVEENQKIKKSPGGQKGLSLSLVENPDIIAGVSSSQHRPFVVGFAAETQDTLRNAREKRKRKGMDMIVVNDVANPDIGFNSEENAVTVIWHGGEEQLPQSSKTLLAERIMDRIVACFADQLATAHPDSAAE
jgi:phosphopantothenoylcysteine decarboxylase/phosphopantothenate--cysteine ligase